MMMMMMIEKISAFGFLQSERKINAKDDKRLCKRREKKAVTTAAEMFLFLFITYTYKSSRDERAKGN